MIGSPQEIPGTPTIRNTEAIVRLQKVFSFAEGGTIQLHGAKIELRGGVNIDEERKGTPIETVGKGKKQTNLVDFLQEDTSIQAILEKAIREDVLKAGQLRAVKLPIASVTTGTEVAQKLDLSKPLTNIQKAEAIGLILQNIGQGKFIEGIADTMNKKLKRTGDFVAIPFMQMDYLNALTAAGGQSLLNAVREADYRPYQINDIDKTRRKVSSSVSPIRSENLRREIAEVTEDQGMNVFEPVKKVVEGIKGKKPVPELQESPSVDLKAAQLMFNLFLPPSELLAMNRLELQIGRETNLGKKESLRHELVKKRQTNYIALLQANGVKGYEANGPIVKGLIEKGVLTVEEVNSIQGEMVKGAKKIMGRKIHELSLHDANIESLIQTFSGNYNKQEGSNVNVTGQIRNAFNSIEISHDTITKLEREFETKGFSKSERTRKAYEQLWEQFSGALKNGGLEVAHKKGETSQETADTEEALKLFFLDRVRTELGMTERKIKFESGFKDPSDVRLSDVEDWGIKGLDLLYRRTQSTQVYKDVGDYDEKMRTLLQKIASQEEPSEGRSAVLVQETKIPKKLDAKTETLQKTLEKNLPNTPPVEKLTKEQADNLSQALGEVISAQLKIGQEPSAVLLDAVGSLVTAENPEFHLSADLLFRIVLGEAVQTPAGKVIIDKLLPQILQTLRDQPQRLEQILGVLDRQQQNGETPDEVAKKLITLIDKYEPSVVKPVAAAPEYTVRRGPDNKLILKMPNGVDINIPNDSIVGVIDQVKEQLVKTPGNESQKKTLSALEALQFAELKAKLENKVSAPLPAASSATSAAAPISATTAPLPTSTAEPVSFESSLQHPAVARAFPSRAAAGAPVTVETAAAAAVPTEVRPLTVTHGVLKVGKNKNGNIVITQPEDKNDDLTGRVLPDGASEFVFSPEDINIVINEAESRLDATLKSDRTNPLRNTRVHNEGLVVDALYEYKRAEVAQSLETHLTALGISKDKVTSRREGKVIVFEVADPVTVPFSGETSEQLKALNEAVATAQGVEVHVAQLNLTQFERQPGETKFIELQLPSDVGTLVAKDGVIGRIGIKQVGTVKLEGKAVILLIKGEGAGKSSVDAIETGVESDLGIAPKLAKDLNGQEIRLDLPKTQKQFDGYTEAGSYIVEASADGKVITVKSLPSGGSAPPPPPSTPPPPPPPTPPPTDQSPIPISPRVVAPTGPTISRANSAFTPPSRPAEPDNVPDWLKPQAPQQPAPPVAEAVVAADAAPSETPPSRPSRRQVISNSVRGVAQKARAAIDQADVAVEARLTGLQNSVNAQVERLRAKRRGQQPSAETSTESDSAVISFRQADLDEVGLTSERTQQLDKEVQRLVTDLSSGDLNSGQRARDTIIEQISALRSKNPPLNDTERANTSYTLSRLMLHPTGSLVGLLDQERLEILKNHIFLDLLPSEDASQADLSVISKDPLISTALAHLIQRDVSNLIKAPDGYLDSPRKTAQNTKESIVNNLILLAEKKTTNPAVRDLLVSQPPITEALLSYFWTSDEAGGSYEQQRNIMRLFDAVDMKPVYIKNPEIIQFLDSGNEGALDIGLRSAVGVFLLPDNPENNKMKDALAKELNRLAKKANKEKWLPELLSDVLKNQEAADQFVEALGRYADDYNYPERTAIKDRLTSLGATALKTDLFGLHYPDLDRFIDSLEGHLILERFDRLQSNYGFGSQTTLQEDLLNSIIKNQMSEGIPNPIGTFHDLMALPPAEAEDRQYNILQNNIMLHLEKALAGLNEREIEHTETFIGRPGVLDAMRTYKQRYNQANRRGINRNPFSKDFPQLEQFLKEEEKSSKESRASNAGSRPEE